MLSGNWAKPRTGRGRQSRTAWTLGLTFLGLLVPHRVGGRSGLGSRLFYSQSLQEQHRLKTGHRDPDLFQASVSSFMKWVLGGFPANARQQTVSAFSELRNRISCLRILIPLLGIKDGKVELGCQNIGISRTFLMICGDNGMGYLEVDFSYKVRLYGSRVLNQSF